ncbi:hypothetical protein [Yinghuangia sp. YIM S10712]|uniref:hypothetical protein n=1 Tax=Yinghuangia sp. YIM S10712 TaxID=3436930 RepID=UPI003F538AFA
MAKARQETMELQTHYAAQVVADLERVAQEQKRVSTEITTLQDRLRSLDLDRAVLEDLRTSLAVEPSRVASGATATRARPKKATGNAGKKRNTTPAKAPANRPSLVDLIRGHLASQPQPRSTAEITDALTAAHPERTIKSTVVRTTVESLVARGLVERRKRGAVVFYTTVKSTPR